MNKVIKTVALVATLSLVCIGCQKEETAQVNVEQTAPEVGSVYRMTYIVDGKTCHVTLYGEEAHDEFIYQMLALAEQGHKVTFFDESKVSQQAAAKDVVTYSTSSKDEAYQWMHDMEELGYTVIVEYDSESGMYNCTAVSGRVI